MAIAALLLLPWPLKLIIEHVMAEYDLPTPLANIQTLLQNHGIILSKQNKAIIFAAAYTLITVFSTLCGSAEKMAGVQVRENLRKIC